MKEKAKILIVDDCDISRDVLAFSFEGRFDCDLVENGAEAIDRLGKSDYACVFLDLMMPKVDGFGVMAYLRGRDGKAVGPHAAREGASAGGAVSVNHPLVPPVIVLSSSTEEGVREKCLAAGALEMLEKPFRIGAINAALAKAGVGERN